MLGFELAARPSIALFKLNSKKEFRVFRIAVYDARMTFISGKLESDHGILGNGLFNFKTSAGRRYVFQYCQFIMFEAARISPSDLNKIGAKFSIFLSFEAHDYCIGKLIPGIRVLIRNKTFLLKLQ